MKNSGIYTTNAKDDLGSLTLGAKHEQIVEFYTNHNQNIYKYIEDEKVIKKKIKKLESKPYIKLKERERTVLFTLQKRLKEVQEKIKNIDENVEENDYYINAMDYLNVYYDNNNSKDSKGKIYEKYLKMLDPSYVPQVSKKKDIYWCNKCDKKKILNQVDGEIICQSCGITDKTIIEDYKQSYSDGVAPQENNYFSYKKITHFKEWIEQCQGNERTVIPKKVFDDIFDKIEEEMIEDTRKIDQKKMRQILQECGHNKYYEHIPYILKQLNGAEPPDIPTEVEERLEQMFKETQIAFKKCCPTKRKNFISYSYTLHKCIELIGTHDHLLPYFPLLKSPQKLRNMDNVWENICNYLNWEFIES